MIVIKYVKHQVARRNNMEQQETSKNMDKSGEPKKRFISANKW